RCAAHPLGQNPGNLDLNQLHARAVNSLRMALWYLNQGESNVPGAGRKAVQALAAINVIRTAQQDLGHLLNDIASTAQTIAMLSVYLEPDNEAELRGALPHAIYALSQRMGWAADMAAERLPGMSWPI
ncbi:hypothetical protein KXX11_004495, partial [Aspergillus fumigatus]